ncbi:MAG: 3'(2'), 5'-bisphosphate nucleotidase [Candidatus Poriferisodalaceae bacterium]|jgi:3'(2'), 5'-bisphosphate nucleotidase
MSTPADHEAAARIAAEAGELLVETRANLFRLGADMWTVRDTGDQRAHDFIMEKLRAEFPNDGILSEEGVDDLERLEKERVWIVDPLDGTREFSEPGRSDWAVHVALCENGIPTAGSVALPAIGVTLNADPAPVLPPRADGPPRMVVSRSRATAATAIVGQAIGAEMLALGSAGAKAMAVVMGHADIYAHSGGQYEWDNCAPAIVAMAAGCHASRCDGSEMTFNHADPWLPDFVICRPEFADEVMAALDEAIRRS